MESSSESLEAAGESERLLESCDTTADALIGVLQEEFLALKSFQSNTLLGLLPGKEFLIRRMSEMMEKLQEAHQGNDGFTTKAMSTCFRQKLKEIQRLNHINRALIEGSLGYWQEFLGVLSGGTNYSQNQGNTVDRMRFKGLTLSREI